MSAERSGDPQGLDLGVLRRVVVLAAPLFRGRGGWRGWLAIATFLVTLALLSTIEGASTFVQRDLLDRLAAHDAAAFYRALVFWLLALFAVQCVDALRTWLWSRISLSWRQRLMNDLVARYLERCGFARARSGAPDNPDERLSEDVDLTTRYVLRAFSDFAWSVLRAAVYLPIVWSIAPALFPLLVAYAALGSFVFVRLFATLARFDAIQLRVEADLRSAFIRIRSAAEAIAFYAGEERERAFVSDAFERVVANVLAIIARTFRLDLAQVVYQAAVTVVPVLLVAPRYFRHELDLGAVLQLGVATTWVMRTFSFLIAWFDQLSAVAACVNRLAGLREHLTEPTVPSGELRSPLGAALRLRAVTVRSPAGEAIVGPCSFTLPRFGGILITGPSGAGKSALLRAVAGLWPFDGTIERPEREHVCFVPQLPHDRGGTLRTLLAYPGEPHHDDDALARALAVVGLGRLIDAFGFDAEHDLGAALSLGEQQRLAFARIVLARPRLAVLDEATSAIDLATETRLYRALRVLGVPYVSVGHRPSLRDLHELELVLDGRGVPPRLVVLAPSVANGLFEEGAVGFPHRAQT